MLKLLNKSKNFLFFQGKHYRLIIQTRVNPDLLQIVRTDEDAPNHAEYWLLPDEKAIRPYGICIYEEVEEDGNDDDEMDEEEGSEEELEDELEGENDDDQETLEQME